MNETEQPADEVKASWDSEETAAAPLLSWLILALMALVVIAGLLMLAMQSAG